MSQELFDTLIRDLSAARDKHGHYLDMASIIISEHDTYYTHYFKEDTLIDIRSIAKSIVCIAMGIAIEQGLYFNGVRIGLDTPIWPFLSKYVALEDAESLAKWKKVVLMDCFRITLGHDKGLLSSSDIKEHDENELLSYVVNYPITREIGKSFVYSNAGTFIVSALVTEYVGLSLDKLVDTLLFAPMGITSYSWKKYGKYCAGFSGLKMHNHDLHKIGRLLIANGVYKGEQLVPGHWINKMQLPQVPSPTHRYIADRAFPKWSYGMNLWICQDGNYYCDGTDGQYMIILPQKDIVITAMGYQPDTEPVSACLGIWK